MKPNDITRKKFEDLFGIQGSEFIKDEQDQFGYVNPFHHAMWMGYVAGLIEEGKNTEFFQNEYHSMQLRIGRINDWFMDRKNYFECACGDLVFPYQKEFVDIDKIYICENCNVSYDKKTVIK